MRILKSFAFLFLLTSSVCFAFEDELNPPEGISNDVPIGMEAIQVTSGYRIIAPEGAKVRKVGAQIIVEGDQEYSSRRFYELTQEIKNLKESLSTLKNQVEALNQIAEDQKKIVDQVPETQEQDQE